MKKMFLTMALAFVAMVSSAQFMVVTTVSQPADSAEWGVSNITDNMGIGYSLYVWNKLYVEPSYTIPVKEDSEGNREGKLKVGVAYRF